MAARRGIYQLSAASRFAVSTVYRCVPQHQRTLMFAQSKQQFHKSTVLLTDSTSGSKFEVINIQDENDFSEHVLKSKVPVVLDFHATWCNPCKLLTPRLEKIVSNSPKRANLVKVDVDKFEDLAVKYKVAAVPTVLAIRDGEVIDSFRGLQDEDIIEGFVEKLVH